MPACLRSVTMRAFDARSGAESVRLRGRPGGRRVRSKACRSSEKIAQTGPTLIPYSRCLRSSRRT